MYVILENEPAVRLGSFLAVFLAVAIWETLRPKRERRASRTFRWLNNIALTAVNTVVLRLAVPLLAVGMALVAAERGWGLFNILNVPHWAAVPLAIVLLDLLIYGQHVVFHYVPVLWRLHKMHHADVDFDVTTGFRFHPVEIVLSMLLKMAAVVALGAPVAAVILFEVILSATSMFNHANAGLPRWIDRPLRWIVVTPDMHRVHHSVVKRETNSNFGFNLPWWDRLFGTYRVEAASGENGMTIGLDEYQSELRQSLVWMLLLPFRRTSGRPEGRSPRTAP